jgi:PIN domain nuclease of toxin-antitoxin system
MADTCSGAPRDPADRMVIATARALGLAVMTRDRAILGYAEAGHVQALAC